MVYLYAGLGVAMLAGIMAIFEMGLSLTGRSLLPSPKDSYLLSYDIKERDQMLLRILADREALPSTLSGLEICQGLELSDELKDDWPFSPAQEASESRFSKGCVMNANADSHRVLVQPDPKNDEMSYRLYSCVLTGGEQFCLFEKEDDV